MTLLPPKPEAKSLFLNALDLPADDRAAYLAGACAGDAPLRAAVEGLLAAHQGDAFLAGHAAMPTPLDPAGDAGTRVWGDDATRPPAGEAAGTVLAGRYELVEPVGEGGMGAVWLARQTQPVRRNVAVKLVKPGMDTRRVLARFEAERQALAVMDHPNIAKVLDAGAAPDGRPFFAMELVEGVPITRFCDDRRLTPRQRLELFLPVCEAVQHAHQKGVIHRDIKPSNVLVAVYGDRPVPKVIDFGVAKAAGADLDGPTQYTGFGAVVGTPAYMAPEQAALGNPDVDTRADVYGLGALLYELLAGEPPFSARELSGRGFLELLRVVREDEPSSLDAKLDAAADPARLAASRGGDPKALRALLRGDLNWIAMRALEKDRGRRYPTAAALADDVRRYLVGEAVAAAPPGRGYRLRKFARRHRREVAVAATVLVALAAGIVGTSVGLVRADAARRTAEAKETEAVAERERADAARTEVEGQRRRAKVRELVALAVSDFLQQDMLLQANTANHMTLGEPVKPNLTVREALDRAAVRVGERFADQPLAQAGVRLAIGRAYAGLQAHQQAAEQLQRAADLLTAEVGADDPEAVAAATDLGLTLAHLPARRAEAVDRLRRAEAATRARDGDDALATVRATHHVGIALLAAGRADEARGLLEDLVRRARERAGADDLLTAEVAGSLAQAYEQLGRWPAAEPLRADAVRITRATLPADHPAVLSAVAELGRLYRVEGRAGDDDRLRAAWPLLTEAFDGRLRRLGLSHPWTWHSARELAELLYDLGRYKESAEYAGRAVDGARRLEKVGSPAEAAAMAIMHRAYHASGLPAAPPHPGLSTLEERVARLKVSPGVADRETRAAMSELARAYQAAGRLSEAVARFETVVHESLAVDPTAADVGTHADMHHLGECYLDAGLLAAAVPMLEETVARRKANLPPWHPNIAATEFSLARAYLVAGLADKALPLYKRAVADLRRVYGGGLAYAHLVGRVGEGLLVAGQYSAAEPYLRESLEVREQLKGHPWETAYAQARLGAALLGLERYDEAEKLLLAAYEEMDQRAGTIPPPDVFPYDHPARQAAVHQARTADLLLALYGARGDTFEEGRWQGERDRHPHEVAPFPRAK